MSALRACVAEEGACMAESAFGLHDFLNQTSIPFRSAGRRAGRAGRPCYPEATPWKRISCRDRQPAPVWHVFCKLSPPRIGPRPRRENFLKNLVELEFSAVNIITDILAVIFDEFFTVNRDLSRELDGY
jgi:hypothetical protein